LQLATFQSATGFSGIPTEEIQNACRNLLKELMGARIYTIVNQKVVKPPLQSAGAYLAYYGRRVLLVDLDPQANATSCLKIDKNSVKGGTYEALIGSFPAVNYILHNPRLKLSILPSSPALAGSEVELVSELARETRLKKALSPIEERYDYILVDCPPSLGLLTLNGIVAARDGIWSRCSVNI
jgi:chromosome partitioning protein